MSTYFSLWTTVGKAKLANAIALGKKLQFAQMVLGDGNGVVPVPKETQTALVNQVFSGPLNQLSVDPDNAAQVIAEMVVAAQDGGWWVREGGIKDADGDLCVVCNCPPSYKPKQDEGSVKDQVVRIVSIVTNTAAVELKIDPAVVLATRQYADSLQVLHLGAVDPHPQYITKTEAQSRIANAVSDLIAGAPGALDTLKELSDALGNDAHFATTIANSLAEKAPLNKVLVRKGVDGSIGTGVDLNTMTSPGIYHQNATASAATGANYPLPVAGRLEVDTNDNAANGFIYQEYWTYGSDGVTPNQRYYRAKYQANAWGAWRAIASVHPSVSNAVVPACVSISAIPASNIGPIFVIEAQELWTWTATAYFTGYRSLLCGRPVDGHTAAPLTNEIDAVGGQLSKTAYAALWGYAQENSLVVSQAVWTANAGAHYFVNVDANYFRVPDLRNVFRRYSGTDADTGGVRAVGTHQDEQIKAHVHAYGGTSGGAYGGLTTGSANGSSSTGPYGGSETRPVNTAYAPRIHI